MTERYWGSVRFYKHLYIMCFTTLVILPLACIFYFISVSDAATKPTGMTNGDEPYEMESASVKRSVDLSIYRKKYPELYGRTAEKENFPDYTVYLTFDDGPSPVTEQVLDVLKKYQVRATFFVVGERLNDVTGKNTLRRILREGHSLGSHSNTHNYRKIYASVEAWLDDFAIVNRKISDITGQKTTIFRFPGGSINVYNSPIYQELIAEMTRRGYVYFDWNVSAGDISLVPPSAQTLYANVVNRSFNGNRIVILLHDSAGKAETVKALPRIIEYYRQKGLSFDRLQNHTYPITFGYRS